MAYKPQHRKDFVLGKSHLFIQQPDEWVTDLFELGQEIRPFPDAAYDYDNTIFVPVESAPDLLDQICDYNVLPRYTNLLEIVEGVKALYAKEEPSAGIPEYHIFDKLKAILEGRND